MDTRQMTTQSYIMRLIIWDPGFDSARDSLKNAMSTKGTGTLNIWAQKSWLAIKSWWLGSWLPVL